MAKGMGKFWSRRPRLWKRPGTWSRRPSDAKPSTKLSRRSTFDLVVLGATFTRNDRHHLPYMVKKANSETSVLVMHADGSRHPYVDACTDTGASLESY